MLEALYTIGHSNQSLEDFFKLLELHSITAVADVRSQPYSKMNPQFDREALSKELKARDIAYVFLGKELGARSEDPACYIEGQVQFERLAKTALFQEGIARVLSGMEQYRVALMCAEKEPLSCHRTILVARHFDESGIHIQHILSGGALESHKAAIERLMHSLELDQPNMFFTKEELIAEAYRIHAQNIAYQRDDSNVLVD